MGVTESVIGQEASGERPRVQSGDFRLGGQSGGEEKSGWVFLGGICSVWIRAQLLTHCISGRG